MHKLMWTIPILIGGCAMAPLTPVIHGNTPGHTCTADGLDRFVGRARSNSTARAIKRASHAAIVRWAPIGIMLTMDYRADRVTVRLGPDHRVTNLSCG